METGRRTLLGSLNPSATVGTDGVHFPSGQRFRRGRHSARGAELQRSQARCTLFHSRDRALCHATRARRASYRTGRARRADRAGRARAADSTAATLALTNEGLHLYQQGRFREAQRLFERALAHATSEQMALLHYNLGMSHAALGEWLATRRYCVSCVRLRPDFVKGHIQLATALAVEGRPCEALVAFINASRLDPQATAIGATQLVRLGGAGAANRAALEALSATVLERLRGAALGTLPASGPVLAAPRAAFGPAPSTAHGPSGASHNASALVVSPVSKLTCQLHGMAESCSPMTRRRSRGWRRRRRRRRRG